MERLPALLLKTIENACEQFRNISFTVHGENDRARISVVFTNEDNTKSKRKSNSTVNRNKKRMKEYNNDNVNIENIENPTNVICSDRSSEIIQITNEEVSTNTLDIMDFDDNPSVASGTTGNIEVIESPNIELSIDTGKELSMSPTCLTSKSVNNVNENKHRLSVGRIENNKCNGDEDNLLSNCTISQANNSNIVSTPSTCDKVKEHNKTLQASRFIYKIVLKQNRSGMDILIGKTQRGLLILYHMGHKNVEIVNRGERDYRLLNKVVTEDFKDVRTTKLMTDAVRQGILEIENLACGNKKL